ncbi:hypothetical protein CTAYLR_005686 [Chrysophaeum taylorii]|uniref:Gfo/Idh/MocA-like oxidoreductase N-terminal domain-containing protein n=1 Tax=Chrysophaeum taylorii TaxID=2483200 RepID=A0AAD7ULZ8_9STRA|nr:hypothetical protein CTAYLR_005686 [Chrysophaeum taylorii]
MLLSSSSLCLFLVAPGAALTWRPMTMSADYAIVGCGVPGRGMGWFHGLQLVQGECPSGRLSDVVEPWFLGGGKDSPAGEAFQKGCQAVWEPAGVRFSATLDDCWQRGDDSSPKIALIAGRTADNPKLFRAAIDGGATHILLEKPGAPSVAELEAMASFAEERKVPVYMGFIKNIAEYVSKALSYATHDDLVTFVSLNDYTDATLGECFERNSEGMLKNMAIHELALAATYFGMRSDNLVRVDDVTGDLRTIGDYTDFASVEFTLINKEGARPHQSRPLRRRRLLGLVTAPDGSLIIKTDMVDDARPRGPTARTSTATSERCARAAIDGAFPEGVATIQTAIEALKLAEYLTPVLKDTLSKTTVPNVTADPVKP